MASPIEIMNQALYHLGSANTISKIDERSAEAEACRLFYWKCVRETMQAFPYTFGTTFKKLQLLMSPAVNQYGTVGQQPTPEYQYAYQYPVDCLHIHRLFSAPNPMEPEALLFDGAWAPGWPWGLDSSQSRVPFKLAQNPNQPGTLWILCAWASLWGEYSISKVPENLFPPSFERAVSFLLACYMAPKLTQGDPNKLGVDCRANYESLIVQSKINNMNEQQDPPLPDSELIRTRNGYSVEVLGGPYPWAALPNGFVV